MSKILIVDDSRFQIELLSQALQEKGFEIVIAEDAMQAGIAVRRTPPDAIVLDINIPGGSGIEVLKRLRRSGKTENIPVVVVSGNQDSETHQAALKLGVAEFLTKPVDLEKLTKLLSDLASVSSEPKSVGARHATNRQ
jgi:two-component system OmpR family response regulator